MAKSVRSRRSRHILQDETPSRMLESSRRGHTRSVALPLDGASRASRPPQLACRCRVRCTCECPRRRSRLNIASTNPSHSGWRHPNHDLFGAILSHEDEISSGRHAKSGAIAALRIRHARRVLNLATKATSLAFVCGAMANDAENQLRCESRRRLGEPL
jgi:hypothetical protein